MSADVGRVSDLDVEGPATVAASALLSVVLLYPSVRTPRDAIERAHLLLDRVVGDILGQLDPQDRTELGL